MDTGEFGAEPGLAGVGDRPAVSALGRLTLWEGAQPVSFREL